MRHLRLRQPVLLLAALWFVLYRNHSGLVRVGLLAALLHECGHVAAWLAMSKTLATGLFNLLPLGDLDGRRMLQSVLP